MPSTQPYQPNYDFASDPDPQNLINATALQAQLQEISNWAANLSAALSVSIREDNLLTDSLVRLRNLHPELSAYISSNVTGPIVTEAWEWRFPVKAASTANILSLFDAQTIDGVSVSSFDTILLKNQNIASQNGLWEVHAVGDPAPHSAGIWVRRDDLLPGVRSGAGWGVVVREGTTNGQTAWGIIAGGETADQPVVGTDALTFFPIWGPFPLPVSRGGTGATTASAALVSLGACRKHVQSIVGNASIVDFVVTHNFNTRDAVVSIRSAATQERIDADIVFSSPNTITVRFVTAPALAETFVVTIVG